MTCDVQQLLKRTNWGCAGPSSARASSKLALAGPIYIIPMYLLIVLLLSGKPLEINIRSKKVVIDVWEGFKKGK